MCKRTKHVIEKIIYLKNEEKLFPSSYEEKLRLKI